MTNIWRQCDRFLTNFLRICDSNGPGLAIGLAIGVNDVFD